MYILLFLATLLLALWVLYASKASSTNVVEASIWSTSKTCAKVLRVTPTLAWWRPFIGLKQLSLSFNRIPPPPHTHTHKMFLKLLQDFIFNALCYLCHLYRQLASLALPTLLQCMALTTSDGTSCLLRWTPHAWVSHVSQNLIFNPTYICLCVLY